MGAAQEENCKLAKGRHWGLSKIPSLLAENPGFVTTLSSPLGNVWVASVLTSPELSFHQGCESHGMSFSHRTFLSSF